ncbi:MAG TPA: Ig-like domain-containing protein [Candidatus Angelobacter sp.]|nr:Ig-like domain-containing protein [Candidatus Angelobacter sp.]
MTCFLGCGHQTGNPESGSGAPIQVTISPSANTLAVGATQQFTAAVTGSSNQSVTWGVNGIAGGNDAVGTISPAGLYAAPSIVPNPARVNITATSQADSTKSASTSVTVTLSIVVSTQSSQVSAFHSVLFVASVKGVNNTAVTWSVNQIPGGTSTTGQIDSSGLYMAPVVPPQPTTVTVSATSQADPTQTALVNLTILPDLTPPSVLSTVPSTGQTAVDLDSSIRIQFSEPLDSSTLSSAVVILSGGGKPAALSLSYDPSSDVITVIPNGILTAGTQYTVTVGGQIRSPAGIPMASTFQWSFTTKPVATASGTVVSPPEGDPSSLTVLSYGGQETIPDVQGNFTASLTPLGTNAVAAIVPGKPFGFLAFSIMQSQSTSSSAFEASQKMLQQVKLSSGLGDNVHLTQFQITASPMIAVSPAKLVLDYQTTAESLLFMTPYLYHSDPVRAAVIMTAIAADQNTASLAQALSAAANAPEPLSDPSVEAALQHAVVSVLTTLSGGNSQPVSLPRVSNSTAVQSRTSPAFPPRSSPVSLALGSAPLPIVTTPNCWFDPGHTEPIPNGLQCLDLDYFNVSSSPSSDKDGNYLVTLTEQTCALGCATDWLVLVAPITADLPAEGVDAIVPGTGQDGPFSPIGGFAPACQISDPSTLEDPQKCTALLTVRGQSRFSVLDPVADVETLFAGYLNISSGITDGASFKVPANMPNNYIVRAFSGGFADRQERGGIWSGNYLNGKTLWLAALAGNAAHSGLQGVEALNVIPTNIEKCALDGLTHSASLVDEIGQLGLANFSTSESFQIAFQEAGNKFLDDLFANATSCIADHPIANFFQISLRVGKWFTGIGTVINVAQAAASGGEAGQRLLEIGFSASPVETAIVSVGLNARTPQIEKISPNPVPGLDGKQQITISGTGFIGGATINWQDVTAGRSGTSIPLQVTSATITVSMNFTSQRSTWQIQVVNPDGVKSNLFQFNVAAAPMAPTIASVSPNPAIGTNTPQPFIINGTNFSAQSTVTLRDQTAGQVFPNRGISSQTSTQLVINPIFTTTAHTWSVEVLNGNLSSGEFTFQVAPATSPGVSSVSPNPVTGSNSAQPFTINGNGFSAQSTVTLRDKTAGQVFPSRAISSQTSTQLVINSIFTTAAHTWSVEVLNGSLSSGEFTFQVVAPSVNPIIASVSPNPVTGSDSAQPFTINGSGFTAQSTVTLRDKTAGQVFANRAISSQTSTQLVINPIFTTAAHMWSVEVLNGNLSSGEFTFQVVAPSVNPIIASVSPNPVTGSDSAQPFTINGTGFNAQSTVTLRDKTAGQVFANRAISSQTSTQLVINPIFTTAAHTWSVEVLNGNLSSGQFTFQVVAPSVNPIIASVSPNPVTGSNSAQPFTINGSGFTAQSTVTLRDKTAGQIFANRTISSQTSTQLVVNPIFTTAAHTWSVEVLNGNLSSGEFTFQVK